MFYFKFFEVHISCFRKYCLFHAVSMKTPPSFFTFAKSLFTKITKLSSALIYYNCLGDDTNNTGFWQNLGREKGRETNHQIWMQELLLDKTVRGGHGNVNYEENLS